VDVRKHLVSKEAIIMTNNEKTRKDEARIGTTEVVFIMDRSGSMSGLEADTIGGFNSMLERQKKEDGEVIWSTVLFDDVNEVVHDRLPIDKVEKLTEKIYYVRGCTALLDAVGGAIRHIGNVHKYAREEDRPDNTLFVITTDGMENASVIYSHDDVKRMIRRQEERYGWEFIFLGANMDAVEAAGRIGISADRSARFHNDYEGVALNFEVLTEEISAFRAGGVVGDSLEKVRKDYKKRK
jgi:uncharacterized protein YegL